jgi:hypothetical protein
MIGSEITEARVIAPLCVLKVPRVENPRSDWNIQKKLLLTCGRKFTT